MTKFYIDGKEVTAHKGETILEVARREGIYIPTMCYISKVSPIASCRLCVVEVKGVDGFVLSCQTPPTEGIEVFTNSPELFQHRQNIMKLYNVNHPLECGVCDKSGECELQNKTLEFGVQSQEFSAKEQYRPIRNWGKIQYDPSLCIMCERCVSTCNEAIGDDAIELKFGGYSSEIVPKGSDVLECSECGECIAVCPVGALISTDFKYSSNAWELQQIPATCSHCSAGCNLFYEVKQESHFDNTPRIYRVKNDIEHVSLCGAGRFGFDFANSDTFGDFETAVSKLREAKTILFSSHITNEEIEILNQIAKTTGAKLVNPEARKFQQFLKAFATTSGETLYNGTLEDIENSNQIIVIGTKIATDNPAVRYAITRAYKKHRAYISYLHPVFDSTLQNTIKQFINYEVGTEEGVIALLADTLITNSNLDLDIGYLSGETNIGEEELETISKIGKRAKNRTLIVGSDLITHEKSENIAKYIGLIQKNSNVKVVIVPPDTNSLGVALFGNLADEVQAPTVGYNIEGDYTIASIGKCDFSVPALNQQEGTFVNIDKKVVKTNVAVPYRGKNLNDLANAILDNPKRWTIDYTSELFGVDFDELQDVEIVSKMYRVSGDVDEVEELPSFDGAVVYNSNPFLQFNPWTAKAIEEKPYLLGAKQFAIANKLSDGDMVRFEIDGEIFIREFKIDNSLKGVIALNPIFDKGLRSYKLLSKYRFQRVQIEKVKSNGRS